MYFKYYILSINSIIYNQNNQAILFYSLDRIFFKNISIIILNKVLKHYIYIIN